MPSNGQDYTLSLPASPLFNCRQHQSCINIVRLKQDRLIAMSSMITVGNLKRASSRLLTMAGILTIAYCPASMVQAQSPAAIRNPATLFENVRIFDGRIPTLSASSNVLVRSNIIERISAAPIDVGTDADVRRIEAGGQVLMPGLIDAHWHAFM